MSEIPVRCFTCGKVTGNKWAPYLRGIQEQGATVDKVLDNLGLTRPCCRLILQTHVELCATLLQYQTWENTPVSIAHMAFGGDEYGDGSDDDN
jgi:DNA-directed RNA polymerase subunit N (RpoN/RPB10)